MIIDRLSVSCMYERISRDVRSTDVGAIYQRRATSSSQSWRIQLFKVIANLIMWLGLLVYYNTFRSALHENGFFRAIIRDIVG